MASESTVRPQRLSWVRHPFRVFPPLHGSNASRNTDTAAEAAAPFDLGIRKNRWGRPAPARPAVPFYASSGLIGERAIVVASPVPEEVPLHLRLVLELRMSHILYPN